MRGDFQVAKKNTSFYCNRKRWKRCFFMFLPISRLLCSEMNKKTYSQHCMTMQRWRPKKVKLLADQSCLAPSKWGPEAALGAKHVLELFSTDDELRRKAHQDRLQDTTNVEVNMAWNPLSDKYKILVCYLSKDAFGFGHLQSKSASWDVLREYWNWESVVSLRWVAKGKEGYRGKVREMSLLAWFAMPHRRLSGERFTELPSKLPNVNTWDDSVKWDSKLPNSEVCNSFFQNWRHDVWWICVGMSCKALMMKELRESGFRLDGSRRNRNQKESR